MIAIDDGTGEGDEDAGSMQPEGTDSAQQKEGTDGNSKTAVGSPKEGPGPEPDGTCYGGHHCPCRNRRRGICDFEKEKRREIRITDMLQLLFGGSGK